METEYMSQRVGLILRVLYFKILLGFYMGGRFYTSIGSQMSIA